MESVESVESAESAPKRKKLTKSSLKSDFEYLKKEDIDFILKNNIDEEGAREIDSVKSMIAYYIESLEIKESILDAVQDVLKPDERNSASVLNGKNS